MNINEVINEYLKMPVEEIDNYILSLAEKYNCEVITVKYKIRDHILNKNKELIKQYEKKQVEYFFHTRKIKSLDNFDLIIENVRCDYETKIRRILNSKNDEQAIDIIRRYNFTEYEFYKMIYTFKNRYRDAIKYFDKLCYLYDKCYPKTEKKVKVYPEKYYEKIIVLDEIVDSNFSIEEYCFYSIDYNIPDIKNMIKYVSNYNKELAK